MRPVSSQLLTFTKGARRCRRVASVSNLLAQAAEFSLYGSNLRSDIDLTSVSLEGRGDPAQIEQVIKALMINARKPCLTVALSKFPRAMSCSKIAAARLLPSGRYIKGHSGGPP